MDCLRRASAQSAWEASLHYEHKFLPYHWMPVVDGDYLKQTTYQLLQDRQFPNYDVMIGMTQDEMTFALDGIEGFSLDTTSELTQDQFDRALDTTLWDLSPGVRNQVKVSPE